MKRRNPDRKEMEAARAWGDDGEQAYETQEMVRAAFESACIAMERYNVGAKRFSGVGASTFAETDVFSSLSPAGIEFFDRFVGQTARSAGIALPPTWRSVYVRPPRDISHDDPRVVALLERTLGELKEIADFPHFEWEVDVVNLMIGEPTGTPRVFEFSIGPIPWRWRRRITTTTHQRDVLNFLGDGGDRGGWPLRAHYVEGRQRAADVLSGDGHLERFARYATFRPSVDAMELAVATRQNLLFVGDPGYIRRLALTISLFFPIAERARPPIVEPPSGRVATGDLTAYVESAMYGILLLYTVDDYRRDALVSVRSALRTMDPLDRPLVVGIISTADYENQRDLVDLIGFPIVTHVPAVSVHDLEQNEQSVTAKLAGPWSAADARARITASSNVDAEEKATMRENPGERQKDESDDRRAGRMDAIAVTNSALRPQLSDEMRDQLDVASDALEHGDDTKAALRILHDLESDLVNGPSTTWQFCRAQHAFEERYQRATLLVTQARGIGTRAAPGKKKWELVYYTTRESGDPIASRVQQRRGGYSDVVDYLEPILGAQYMRGSAQVMMPRVDLFEALIGGKLDFRVQATDLTHAKQRKWAEARNFDEYLMGYWMQFLLMDHDRRLEDQRNRRSTPNPARTTRSNPGEVYSNESLNMAAGRYFARQMWGWGDIITARPFFESLGDELDVLSDAVEQGDHANALTIIGTLDAENADAQEQLHTAADFWGGKIRVTVRAAPYRRVIQVTREGEYGMDHEIHRRAVNRDSRGGWSLYEFHPKIGDRGRERRADASDASAMRDLLDLSSTSLDGAKIYWFYDFSADPGRTTDGDFVLGWWMEILLLLRGRADDGMKGMKKNPSKDMTKIAKFTPQKVVAKLKRDLDLRIPKGTTIGSPRDLVKLCQGYMDLATEMFVVIFLDIRNQVVGYQEMSSGGTAGVEVHTSGIFQAALLAGAAGFVTMHNHPSGNPTPSNEDHALWKRIRDAGMLMGVPVVDNLVIGANGRYYSESESEGA